jgi:NAD(P)-dependent dehydrogenase (short-subunit alcohol dehydrogenase family)
MGDEMYRYDNAKVVVVGGATGMGAATAKQAKALGAEIVVLDVAEVTYEADQVISVDLRDQASVDAAVEAIEGPVHAIFACAGVADGTNGLMLINFTSQRHLVEKMISTGRVGPGGSVAFVSSVAGAAWMTNLETVKDFCATPDWDRAAEWIDAHEGTDNYGFSKEAINCYVAEQAFPMLKKGMRINAILPGPTDTPLAQANADLWFSFGRKYREAADVATLVPEQMASSLLFLGSRAASGVNGVTLLVDQGHVNASLVDAYDDPIVKMITGTIPWDFDKLDL